MNILHIASLYNNKAAGPNLNVPQNVLYGNKYENVALLNVNDEDSWLEIPENKNFWLSKYNKIENLPEPFNCPDIVVFHGVYFFDYIKLSNELYKKSIPYIIVPRCSMTKSALNQKKIKKLVANFIFFNRFISRAKYIQFLTDNEYLESKNNFGFNDYFVLGNGTTLPNKLYKIKKRSNFVVSFIGRYDVYHKGLDLLLETINSNSVWFRSNHIVFKLYGIDFSGGKAYIDNFVNENKLHDIVLILGPVFDEEKEKAILDSDLFIHTSRLEGQPTSIIEAISYGVPVVVTPGTNVCDIVRKNTLGYTSIFDSKKLFLTLKKAFNDKENYGKISNNEIEFARKNFSWDSIVKMSFEIYKR